MFPRVCSRKNCPGGVLPAGIVQGLSLPGQRHSYLHDRTRMQQLCSPLVSFRRRTRMRAATTFIGGNNSPTNLKEEVVRIDHNFTGKFSMFGHFIAEQVSQGYGVSQWSGANVPR